jgi:hypothetical protein
MRRVLLALILLMLAPFTAQAHGLLGTNNSQIVMSPPAAWSPDPTTYNIPWSVNAWPFNTTITCDQLTKVCTSSVMPAKILDGTNSTAYYVSAVGGTASSDTYNGLSQTWTGGTNGPFKTLGKLLTSLTGYSTTATSGDGTTATVTGNWVVTVPIGAQVKLTGITPTGYNGTYTVTASSAGSISFANATTGAQTVAGKFSTSTLGNYRVFVDESVVYGYLDGWNGGSPTTNGRIEFSTWSGGNATSAPALVGNQTPTWTQVGTSNVYSTTLPTNASNCGGGGCDAVSVYDAAHLVTAQIPTNGGPAAMQFLAPYASGAGCYSSLVAGSWCSTGNGGTLYVWASDSRSLVGDTQIWPFLRNLNTGIKNGLLSYASGSPTVYIENMRFWGNGGVNGRSAFAISNSSTTDRVTAYFVNVDFSYAGGWGTYNSTTGAWISGDIGVNGFSSIGGNDVFTLNCHGSSDWDDVMNFHRSGSVTQTWTWIDINSYYFLNNYGNYYHNGIYGVSSNDGASNSHTGHDPQALGVFINAYGDSSGAPFTFTVATSTAAPGYYGVFGGTFISDCPNIAHCPTNQVIDAGGYNGGTDTAPTYYWLYNVTTSVPPNITANSGATYDFGTQSLSHIYYNTFLSGNNSSPNSALILPGSTSRVSPYDVMNP